MDTIAFLFTFAVCSQSWSVSQSSSVRVHMVERMHCRGLVFVHFRGGSSSFPFSSSSYWLSSLASSSKLSLEICCPWLYNISVTLSAVTLSNPTSCTSPLMTSTMFSTGSNPVKSCIKSGRIWRHTPFK